MTAHRTILRKGPIVLAAGGTGGHIFPALALAEELWHRGYSTVLITNKHRTVPLSVQEKFSSVYVISACGLAGKSFFRILQGIVHLTWGFVESLFLIRKLRPSAIVGFGGYSSVPPMAAALLMGYPTVVHEQNAILGKANRLLAPLVTKLALTFVSKKHSNAVYTGTPVRIDIRNVRVIPYTQPSKEGMFRLLIIGGSQGAHVFDTVIPYALVQLPESLRSYVHVSQQVRTKNQAAIAMLYTRCGITGELESFFDDIPTHLSKTHLVIARSGASTVAELTVSGRPAILIPYPHAIANHQTINAQAMVNIGSVWLIPQDTFKPESLATKLRTLCMLPTSLMRAASCAQTAAFPDSVKYLADVVTTL